MTTRNDTFVKTACLALFAVALIIVAPLISVSLQKDPMGAMPGMHHDMSHISMAGDHHMTPAPIPVDHAEACGYCVLLAHVPGLLLALAVLITFFLQPERLPVHRPALRLWHFCPWLWPDTRAPPTLSAFPC